MMRYQEHQRLTGIPSRHPKWEEGMPLKREPGLDRRFFRWWEKDSAPRDEEEAELENKSSGYYASYVIGAQWLDEQESLVITPKVGCDRIDFLRLFSGCLQSGIEAEALSKIYEIDLNQPPIKAPELQSVLSPLIIVHFLSVVREVLRAGLKKDYVQREENLKKVKGHIAILRHERTNVLRKRPDKVYCRYQEYSVDIPENRLLKKALIFSQKILYTHPQGASRASLEHALHQCLSAFAHVGDEIEVSELKHFKYQKLFRTYSEAIRLAQIILRRYDYSLTNIESKEEACPVFWLDMSLLFEHYVLGLLREAYGDKIEYQAQGNTGRPDFICHAPLLVMDAKYMPRFNGRGRINSYIIRQLSGYARDRKLFNKLPSKPIRCLVIYPKLGKAENPFLGKAIKELRLEEEETAWRFYRLAVPLPTLEEGHGERR